MSALVHLLIQNTLIFINNIKITFMMEGQSPRKNLWKNLKTQKTKQSGIEPTINSPVVSYSKESNHNSEPLRSFHLQKQIIINRNSGQLEDQFGNVEKEMEIHDENNTGQIEKKNTLGLGKITPLGPIEPHSKNNNKVRRFSIGEESIVQEIVDFKNQHNLDIGDFQQDQQPMIMSLGSQSNPAIRMLKLSRVKDDLQKLQATRAQIIKFLNDQKKLYHQLFEKSFHELLSYVLEFYYQKLEAQKQEFQQKQKQKQKINKLASNRRSIGQQDTPRFAKPLQSLKSDESGRLQTQFKEKQSQYEQQIHKLQQELLKSNLQKQTLQITIKRLRTQNQEMNQSIFDYEQKNAQFELEVNKKVEEITAQKGGSTSRAVSNEDAENDRRYYLDQILALQKQIQMLDKNSYNHQYNQELNQIREELERKDQQLSYREKQLIQNERLVNELQVEINSQKLDLERRQKNFQFKQLEIRSFQLKLEQKQMELNNRQKQISNKEQIQAHKESQIFQKSHLTHRPKVSSDQFQYNLDLKLKNLSSFKTTDGGRPRNQKDWQHNTSYALTQGTRKWQFSALSQKNDIKRKAGQYATKKRNSKSKQKEKQKANFNNTFISSSRPAITAKTLNNQSYSHSNSATKQIDRSRLDNLGTKLQNLRNQIRKQIRDTQ